MDENDRQFKECGLADASPLLALRARPYRNLTALVLAAEVVCAVILVISPLAQRHLIDAVNGSDRIRTIETGLVLVVLLGIIFLCRTVSYLLRFRLTVEVRCRLKSAVFHRLLGLPESYLRAKGSGYFFNRLQADSTEIVNFYGGNALLQFADSLKFLFSWSVLLFLNWKTGLLLVPFLLIQCWIYIQYRTKQYRLGHRIQECTASERYRMQEYLSGHTTLKTHDMSDQAVHRLDQGFARWRILAFNRLFHENRFRVFLLIPYYLFCGGVAVFGLDQVLRHAWTLGSLWALLLLIRQVFSPLQRLALARFQMQQVQAAWDRLRQISHAADAGENGTCGEFDLSGEIVFSNVSFSYGQDHLLFENLNLSVKPKELLFLTGENGTGKSTLFHLLLRLYDPKSGSIAVGGRDIRNFPLTRYRSRIGYLDQTPEFFPGTVRENLLLGKSRSDEEIFNVLRLLKSEDLILHRPEGLDTVMQERGQNFSGGERLRLALTREFLRDTDILLLDEPAGSLDFDARTSFYEILPQLQGKRTVIVIVHDRMKQFEKFRLHRLQNRNESVTL